MGSDFIFSNIFITTMKRITLIASIVILLSACASQFGVANLGSKVKQLEIGMTKKEVIKVLGTSYDIIGAGRTPQGTEETIRYSGLNAYGYYVFHFLDNELMEFYHEVPPQPIEQNVNIKHDHD